MKKISFSHPLVHTKAINPNIVETTIFPPLKARSDVDRIPELAHKIRTIHPKPISQTFFGIHRESFSRFVAFSDGGLEIILEPNFENPIVLVHHKELTKQNVRLQKNRSGHILVWRLASSCTLSKPFWDSRAARWSLMPGTTEKLLSQTGMVLNSRCFASVGCVTCSAKNRPLIAVFAANRILFWEAL